MESNLIYRDVTVALLKDEEYPCENDYDEGFMAALDRAIWIVEKYIASAQPEKRWIPCSERLPEVNESVLATTVWDDVTIAWRIGFDKWFIHEEGINAITEDLRAWMPLPEPYQEAEE